MAWSIFDRLLGSLTEDQESDPRALTIGPGSNEVGTTYSFGPGSHVIRMLADISPDAVLVHQSKLVGFRKIVGDSSELPLVTRSVKSEMLRAPRNITR